MEFHLEKHAAHVAMVQLREEKHGEESVLATDVRITLDTPNDFLSYLSPTLKWSLYDRPDSAQGELVEDKSHLPRLRYAEIPKIHWDGEMRADVVIHNLVEPGDTEMEGATIDKMVLECLDGGTVTVTFRVKVLPAPKLAAALPVLLGKDVRVTVRPPETA